jgi:putative addiction module CopG family antidote
MAGPITLTLPDDLSAFAEAQVAAGRFADVEEVVAAGLAVLKRGQERHEAKLSAINAAIEEGERSGDFEGNPFDSVRRELGLPPRSR